MNKQRFAIFIVGIVGMVATFLPWYGVAALGNLTGFFSSGWFTFIMFIIILFLVMRGNSMTDMTNGNVWLVSCLGIIASVVVLWRILTIDFSQDMVMDLGGRLNGVLAADVSVRYGAWLVVVAGFCIPLVGFIFRSKDSIKNERYE